MLNKISEKLGGKWMFVAGVVLAYLITAMIDFDLARRSWETFVFLFKKIIPTLVLVFALMFFFNFFLDAKKISRLAGRSAGLKGWIIVVIAGVLSSGPVYMWYPLLADLKEKGMSDGSIAAFLYSRAIKIPQMPMLVYYFGLPFTIVLTAYMFLFSIINGVLVDKLLKLHMSFSGLTRGSRFPPSRE